MKKDDLVMLVNRNPVSIPVFVHQEYSSDVPSIGIFFWILSSVVAKVKPNQRFLRKIIMGVKNLNYIVRDIECI